MKFDTSKIDLLEDVFGNIDLDHDSIDRIRIRSLRTLFIPDRGAPPGRVLDIYQAYNIQIDFLEYPNSSFGEYLYETIKLSESYCGLKFISVYFPNIGHYINLDGSSWPERSSVREMIHIKSGEPRYKNKYSIQNMTIKFIEY